MTVVQQQIILVAATVAALVGLVKLGMTMMRWAARMTVMLNRVQAEFGNNGGSTLRDAVDRLTAGQQRAGRDRTEMERVLVRVDRRTQVLEEQASDMTRRVVAIESATSLRSPLSRSRSTDLGGQS